MDRRALITPHFTWGELLRTDSRDLAILDTQDNPPDYIQRNLRRLCASLLEPARALTGSLRVNSGWRCPALNASLSGSSRRSRHMEGLAADVFPLTQGIVEAFEAIAGAGLAEFDQLILEYGRWLHLGAAPTGTRPRGQLLMIFSPGSYEVWDPSDERVIALREVAS